MYDSIYEILKEVKFKETERRMVIARDWVEGGRRENWEVTILMITEISVWEDEKSSGDGWWQWLHNNVNVFNATELYTLKHSYTDIFMLYRFYHNF